MPAHRNILVLTGAGIARGSGLAAFRDRDGIWQRVRIAVVAAPEAAARDPARMQACDDPRLARLREPGVAPNAAHLALVGLVRHWVGEFRLVIRTMDDLHARAGRRRLLPMHRKLAKARCLRRGAVQGRARTAGLDPEPSAGTPPFDAVRHGPATERVPAFAAELPAGSGR